MSAHKPSLGRVLSDTSRIISAHSRHFLALSLLFLFPLSLAATIYPFLFHPTSLHSHYHRRLLSYFSKPETETPHAGKSQLLIQLLYFLFSLLFNLSAVSSITYSTFHGFYGRPVKLISSLKSILVSFFPLLATLLVTEIIIGLIVSVFLILVLLAYNGSEYFLPLLIVIATLLIGLLIYLQVQWYLMSAVVVLESEWGFVPLKRSSYLVKGMRGVVFSTLLSFGIPSVVLSIWYLSLAANVDRVNDGWTTAGLVQMVVFAGFFTVLPLYGLAANTVLFVYCKELHGESSVFEVDEKVGGEYVPLPFDVVNVV